MKTKLEVIRLTNDDVIATSGYLGVLNKDDGESGVYYIQLIAYNTVIDGPDKVSRIDGNTSGYLGYTTKGFYHCDSKGNIISACSHGAKDTEKLDYHNISGGR